MKVYVLCDVQQIRCQMRENKESRKATSEHRTRWKRQLMIVHVESGYVVVYCML